jgi:hypothetical protein
MSESIKQIKSQNQLTAAKQIRRFSSIAAAMEVLRRPGGIIRLLETAEASESKKRKLVRAFTRIRERALQAIIDIGDDRRARGQSVPLCWLPDGPAAEGIVNGGLDHPKHPLNRE